MRMALYPEPSGQSSWLGGGVVLQQSRQGIDRVSAVCYT
jgi:hypothetical protein